MRHEALAYDRDEFHESVGGLATFACARDGNPLALGVVVPTARLEAKLPVLRTRCSPREASFREVSRRCSRAHLLPAVRGSTP